MKEKILKLIELRKNPLSSQETINKLRSELQYVDVSQMNTKERKMLNEALQ